MLPHRAWRTPHGSRRWEQQVGFVCASWRASADNVRWSRLAGRCPRPGAGVRTDHAGSQKCGLGLCCSSKLYFETKHNCTEKCTMGFMARACLDARPGSERRRRLARVPLIGQNTVLPAQSVRSLARRPATGSVTVRRPAGRWSAMSSKLGLKDHGVTHAVKIRGPVAKPNGSTQKR